jgi:hypothetical protein
MLRRIAYAATNKQQQARQTRRYVSPRPQLLLGHILKARLSSPVIAHNQLFCHTRQPSCIYQPHALHPQPHQHIITSRFVWLSYQCNPLRSSNFAGNCAASASSDSASHA